MRWAPHFPLRTGPATDGTENRYPICLYPRNARLDERNNPDFSQRVTATLKGDRKGRYSLGRFLPSAPQVQVQSNPDGSVTLRPVKPRMTPAQARAHVRNRAGTWEGPMSGVELLKMTRGA